MNVARGWQFFMHPGPTNIPHRVLQAMQRPAIDFMGPEFVALRDRSLERLKAVLKTKQGFAIVYAASGHGAWDASIANLFSPGDKVLVCQAGYFSENWSVTARQYGVEVESVVTPERRAVDPNAVAERLAADKSHAIKAVLISQNETATGMRHPVAEVRAAMNRVKHPALYCVDTISSLASYDFRMDEWGVDLVVGGSQKARNPRRYWDWRTVVEDGRQVRFCGTAPIPYFYGLEAALDMIEEEGLENVFARHRRLAQATRACVRAWSHGGGPEIYSLDADAACDSLTAVLCPAGHDADKVRAIASDKYSVALGRGLGALQGRVFRIGHMGDLNEAMLLGALGGIELALAEAGMPHARGGVAAAMDALSKPGSPLKAAGTTASKTWVPA